jgi:hypothetical protein
MNIVSCLLQYPPAKAVSFLFDQGMFDQGMIVKKGPYCYIRTHYSENDCGLSVVGRRQKAESTKFSPFDTCLSLYRRTKPDAFD